MNRGVSLVLATTSPARIALAKSVGIDPVAVPSGVDETEVEAQFRRNRGIGDLDFAALAVALAQAKARAVATSTSEGTGISDTSTTVAAPAVVVGADTILEFEGQALGKPGDAATATSRLLRMSGGQGVLHTGHCAIDLESGKTISQVESTPVWFADISPDEIEEYVATGEPLQVAGSFTIDGFGAAFVERIDGSFTNVVGLSIPLLRKMVAELGYSWPDFWR